LFLRAHFFQERSDIYAGTDELEVFHEAFFLCPSRPDIVVQNSPAVTNAQPAPHSLRNHIISHKANPQPEIAGAFLDDTLRISQRSLK
jgi:hypothetical protein